MPGSCVRIALYTIFRCTNYGAVLQAYALARTLRAICGDGNVDVINHRMDPRDTHLLGKITNPNTPWFQRWRNRRKFAARHYRPDLFESRRAKTIRIIADYIRPTEKLYTVPRELRGLPPYATVVVGSDQVWNPILNRDFGHNPYLGGTFPEAQDRVAYAASFGVSAIPEACREEYKATLSRFRTITVREESGAAICRNLLPAQGDGPLVVLDPTLLLTAEDWRGVLGDSSADVAGRSMAAYWVRTVTGEDIAALERLAEATGVPIRLMSAGPLPKLDFPDGVVPYVEADPFDFVRTISNAESVVTDSFHGLQFATLFRRPFLALGDIDGAMSNASRLVDFCRRYGLSGGIQDIGAFRRLEGHPFADFRTFDSGVLSDSRDRSLLALGEMLPKGGGS